MFLRNIFAWIFRWCNIVYFHTSEPKREKKQKEIYMHICFWMTFAINIYLFFICSFRLHRVMYTQTHTQTKIWLSNVRAERVSVCLSYIFFVLSEPERIYTQNDSNSVEIDKLNKKWNAARESGGASQSNFSQSNLSNNNFWIFVNILFI